VNTLQYVAVDAVGNVSPLYTRTVKVDETSPALTALDLGTKTISESAADSVLSFTARRSSLRYSSRL
jgi:hypothetical protein